MYIRGTFTHWTSLAEKIFVPKASTLLHRIFYFNSLALVVSEILGGHKCTLGGPAPPRTPPSGKILTYAEVLVYACKVQLRSSINVQLTDSSLCNNFCIKRSPKMGFWDGFWGVGAKIFGGNPLGMQRPPIYTFSDIFGPHLTRRAVAFCMDIAICHRRKFGQLWGSPAPLPEVAEKLRCRKAPLWTFDYHMEKSESFCDVTPEL